MHQVSILVYLEDPKNGVLSTAFSILVGCYGSHGIKATIQEWTGKVSHGHLTPPLGPLLYY